MSVLSGEFFIRYECVRGRVDIGTLFNIYTVQFVLNTPPLIFSAANQGGVFIASDQKTSVVEGF